MSLSCILTLQNNKKTTKNKGVIKERSRKKEEKLYLYNLIIFHLESTSIDAPSFHQLAHCEDRASVAGQHVDFPLSLSQRGSACPYISRFGHARSPCHLSAPTNATKLQ